MPTDTTEKGFEEALESHLLGHGYDKGSPGDFDKKLALNAKTLLRFLQTTQPQAWDKLKALYGAGRSQGRRQRRP